jgi:hypothetical protein
VDRAAVLKALQAEGVPCAAGYGYPLFRQPMFLRKAFGPYLPGSISRLDYSQVSCPHSERVCRQSIWLEHSLFLGSSEIIEDIARAFEKIYASRAALQDWWISQAPA